MEFLRRRLGLIVRAAVSVLAVWYVIHTNNWSLVWANILTMDVRWLLFGALFFIPTLLIVSWRWRLLLAVHDVHMRFWRVFELTMIGQFFSTVGVGTTGGDVFKIFYVARAVPERRTAVAFTVIVDRVIGLIALLLFGVVFSFFRLHVLLSQPETKGFTGTFYIFALVAAVGAIGASLGPMFLTHPTVVALGRKLPMADRRRKLYGAYDRTARAVGVNLLALVISLPSHFAVTVLGYCVMCAMGEPPDFVTFCAIMAIVNMLIALPLSISGIGLREFLFPKFLALVGISSDHAVTFSLTYFAISIFWNLVGAPFYFFYRHETHSPAPQVDEVRPIFSEP
jgi:uncharacterized membrane protein YbhN (UPF0104 family)